MDRNEGILDHYNKTAELTWNLWESRNRAFLMLIVAISLAAVLANDEMLLGVLKSICEQGKVKCESLAPSGMSYLMVHSVILVLVCYYMLTLYHRTASVLMSYRYMGELEKELRYGFGFASGDVTFTREGAFYMANRPKPFSYVKWLYSIIIGVLLFLCYFVRFSKDFNSAGNVSFRWNEPQTMMLAVDTCICALTVLAFVFYLRASFRLGSSATAAT